ncbi:MAG: hypothetical protein O3C39_07650 [Planctomycetota bacterium]|jgi:hypothetical protein|nr:hypothetical protein [Planctomycetota bacterium]MDA1201544.1 hypothetical protein [Planctomycetota bacterium]
MMPASVLTGCFLTIFSGFPLVAADSPAADSDLVCGEVVLPADLGSFAGRRLEIRLYKIHPLLADAPATLVDVFDLEEFGHEQGRETKQAFEVGGDAVLEPDMSYYITCFVLDGDARTHIGETPDKDLCSVLTRGSPREVTLTARAVR